MSKNEANEVVSVAAFRDRPFNLKGGEFMFFCFVQKNCFGQLES